VRFYWRFITHQFATDRFLTEIDLQQKENNWNTRADARELRVGIVGLGYVGLPLALLFSEQKFRVTGFDVDAAKVATLNAGGSYIHRIEPEHIRAAQASGFAATADFAEIANVDAVLICVPTPLSDHRTPDMSYIEATMAAIAPHLQDGQLVVLESTTYPGTTEEIVVPRIEAAGKTVVRSQLSDVSKGGTRHQAPGTSEPAVACEIGQGFSPDNPDAKNKGASDTGVFVAFSPEREDPGNTTVARRDIPKVVGGLTPEATEMAAALYGTIFARVIRVSSPAVAEMTKLLENIYRCVNIALVNELKLLCLRMNIDIWEVIAAAATKPFGFQPFYPGPGLGGHCIPIDPFYLSWKAKEFDFSTRFIELAGEVNEAMPYAVIQSVITALNARKKALNGSKVLVLGLAYKKDVDDLRESPSLVILDLLKQAGAEVFYNDPFFPKVGRGRKYALDMTSTPLDDLTQYDCVMIVTDHSSYNYETIVRDSQLVVDTRNATKGIVAANVVRC
jgi:UDP-N-acetyl-D-glucosamine dehydrogenase